MSPPDSPLRRLIPLLLAVLFAGPVACDPAVSRRDLDSAQERLDALTTRTALLDQQLDDARKEYKALQSFGGPEHEAKRTLAMALREEKTELENLKKDINGRLQNFEKEAARHRDALIKMKQQQQP